MPPLGTVAKGWIVDRLLARLGRAPRPRRRGERRRRSEPAAPPPGRLLAAMAAFLAVGMPAMLLFDAPVTRVIGVLCIFGFIISGVFAIARPEFLDDDA